MAEQRGSVGIARLYKMKKKKGGEAPCGWMAA